MNAHEFYKTHVRDLMPSLGPPDAQPQRPEPPAVQIVGDGYPRAWDPKREGAIAYGIKVGIGFGFLLGFVAGLLCAQFIFVIGMRP